MKSLLMLARANLAEHAPRPGDTGLRAGQYPAAAAPRSGAELSVWARLRGGMTY